MRLLAALLAGAALAASPPALAGSLVPSKAAGAAPGQMVTVCGVMVAGGPAPGGGVLLQMGDPGQAGPAGFAILIAAEDRTAFAGSPERDLQGKRVCVTGIVRAGAGLPPHIKARGPFQIEDIQKTVDKLKETD